MKRLFAILLLCTSAVNCARILCVFPNPLVYHQNVFQPFWKELSKRHEVVVLTPSPLKDDSLTNLTEISWGTPFREMDKFKDFFSTQTDNLSLFGTSTEMTQALMKEKLNRPEVANLINNRTEHFDLVVVEGIFHVLYAFGKRFNCPTIAMMSIPATIPLHDAMGNPSHPVYNPDPNLAFKLPLNILQRTLSVLYSVWIRVYHTFYYLPRCDEIVKEVFGNNIPSLYDIERGLDLMFVVSNQIFQPIRPNFPAVVELSGLHIREKKPLPLDIESFINSTEEGVIYFSLSSNIKPSQLTPEKVNTLVKAFSELPYKVLWKWESELLPNITGNNIKFSNWFPQQDILAHSNVKAFITQGGLKSIEESIHHRVPMIGISINTEQYNNVMQIVKYGIGKQLEFDTFTKESLQQAILDLITNQRYKENIQRVALLSEDTPIKSLEKAVWWTEYVIRHNGAKFLRSPAIDIPWYQYLLLDVLAVFFSAAFICYRFFIAVRFIKSNNVVEHLVSRYKIKTS